MTTTERPPEAELIERLRLAARPKLSVRKAAELADLSEGRWRQIALGYTAAAAGVRVPVRAPAETLARMALVVGASGRDLIDAGRPDAAAELNLVTSPTSGGADAIKPLTAVSDEELLAEVRRRLNSRWHINPSGSPHGNAAPNPQAGVSPALSPDDVVRGAVDDPGETPAGTPAETAIPEQHPERGRSARP